MFTFEERERIELKALEQAIREAQLARIELEPLLPVTANWLFALTPLDVRFLQSCPYPISPA
jgi:hypothetical protein